MTKPMKARVVVKRCPDYDLKRVEEALRQGLGLLGSICAFVKPTERVLIKPNLLVGEDPQKAVNTHPAVVEGVVKLVLEAGGKPVIGDSPMFGLAAEAAKKAGYEAIAQKYKIDIVNFTQPLRCDFKEGRVYKSFEIEKTVKECDKVINVAKLKTHAQMFMTLCVKNMFGIVIGRDKLKWHFVAGRSYDLFAKILLELYALSRPALNILDGIVGMEGYGPLTGTPRPVGVLIIGQDGVAVDCVACEVVGISAKNVPVLRVNEELAVGVSRLEDILITGDDWSDLQLEDFKHPPVEAVNEGRLPDFVKNMIRDLTTSRPVVSPKRCKLCRRCIEACPAEAIEMRSGRLHFHYDKCIRCYCCIEACPHTAIRIATSFLAKMTK